MNDFAGNSRSICVQNVISIYPLRFRIGLVTFCLFMNFDAGIHNADPCAPDAADLHSIRGLHEFTGHLKMLLYRDSIFVGRLQILVVFCSCNA